MSVIYYCDALSCSKKEPGVPVLGGWESPEGWFDLHVENDTFDACCQEHFDALVETTEEKEEESEAG